jgi:hypothetical protein
MEAMKLVSCGVATIVTMAAGLATARDAAADSSVTIVLTPDGEQFATDNGDTPAELEGKLETKIAEVYNAARVEEYLRAFSNATSFSNRGIGVDYASNGKSLTIGVAGNVALSATDLDINQDANEYPVGGVAPNLTIMAGLNLSRWNLPKLTLFANGFYRKASLNQLDGSIANLGVHAQYKVLGKPTTGKKSLLLQWGGLDLTAGAEYTKWSLGIGDTFTSDFPLEGSGGTTTVTATADTSGRFDLTSSALVFPIEGHHLAALPLRAERVRRRGASTCRAGSSTADASLEATMTVPDENGGQDIELGTATVTANGEAGPSVGRLRALAGLQVNFWKLKLFFQGNLIPLDTASVAFGPALRVVARPATGTGRTARWQRSRRCRPTPFRSSTHRRRRRARCRPCIRASSGVPSVHSSCEQSGSPQSAGQLTSS